jgi:hypothetical protein
MNGIHVAAAAMGFFPSPYFFEILSTIAKFDVPQPSQSFARIHAMNRTRIF